MATNAPLTGQPDAVRERIDALRAGSRYRAARPETREGIDQFLDMGRTATNVVGNAVATSVITKWEGMLEVEEPAEQDLPHAPAHTVHDGARGLELDPSNFEDERSKPV